MSYLGELKTNWREASAAMIGMGFGYSLSVAQVMQAALLWQLATLARSDALRVRPMIAVITLASIAGCIIAWRFILPVPALFSLVLTAALVVAYVVAR